MANDGGQKSSPGAVKTAVNVATIAGTIAASVHTAATASPGQIAQSSGEGWSRVQTINAQRGTDGK